MDLEKSDRQCPKCDECFGAVADRCRCPNCGHWFNLSEVVAAAAEKARLAKENALPLPPTKMKLSSSDRKIFRKALAFPWPRDGGHDFYTAFAAAISEDSWHMFPTQNGITRRVIDDEPAEIVRYTYIGTRLSWHGFANPIIEVPATEIELFIGFMSQYVEIPKAETYNVSAGRTVAQVQCDDSAFMWIAYLNALAINDLEAVERMESDLPRSLQHFSEPYPSHYPPLFNLVFGLARGDTTLASESIATLRERKLPSSDAAIRDCLVAIYERSPVDFADALLRCGKSTRRLRSIDPHARLIAIGLHGLWALAHRVAPAIVELWNVDSPLPWDAGLHRWNLANENAAGAIDWSRVPNMRPSFIDMAPVTTFR